MLCGVRVHNHVDSARVRVHVRLHFFAGCVGMLYGGQSIAGTFTVRAPCCRPSCTGAYTDIVARFRPVWRIIVIDAHPLSLTLPSVLAVINCLVLMC